MVMRQVLLDGLRIAAIGTVLGLAAAMALSRTLERFVFEISTNDPWILAAACGLSIGVALLATFFPARRAVAVDPTRALSSE